LTEGEKCSVDETRVVNEYGLSKPHSGGPRLDSFGFSSPCSNSRKCGFFHPPTAESYQQQLVTRTRVRLTLSVDHLSPGHGLFQVWPASTGGKLRARKGWQGLKVAQLYSQKGLKSKGGVSPQHHSQFIRPKSSEKVEVLQKFFGKRLVTVRSSTSTTPGDGDSTPGTKAQTARVHPKETFQL
jgi:hypothetical protein